MNLDHFKGLPVTPERLVEALSEYQHLHPHDPMKHSVTAVGDKLGVCPGAAGRAIELLCIDGSERVGRLRRSELVQLGRTIHRLWRQNAAAPVA